jgi:uncharacterized LabA/DUF88 family protein
MPGRIAVFMDGGYLDKSLREFPRVDREKFASCIIAEGEENLRTYYYDCPPFRSAPPTREENDRFARKQRFFDALRRRPRFEVREGYLVHKGYGPDGNPIFQQKGADIYLAVDMLTLASRGSITKAYLIAGDGDFVPVVRAVKDYGVSVHLFHGSPPNGSYSQLLWDVCDDRTRITQALISRCLMPPQR